MTPQTRSPRAGKHGGGTDHSISGARLLTSATVARQSPPFAKSAPPATAELAALVQRHGGALVLQVPDATPLLVLDATADDFEMQRMLMRWLDGYALARISVDTTDNITERPAADEVMDRPTSEHECIWCGAT